ncbi:MAG: hypothetical protein ACJ8KX_07505, partial [Chthoniobacterales bacterium]
MGRLTGAVVSGLIFGSVAVALMLPMQFPDKRTALLGAFASRFAIGFTIGCVQLRWLFGLLLSLPDALVTKAYAPILVVGAVGSLVI